MTHRSLWLTVCGIVFLCVVVPHASCHPTPDDSKHEMMPYYQQAEEPEHYFPSYDKEDEEEENDSGKEKINLQEFEPVLADSTIAPGTELVEESRKMALGSSANKVLNGYLLLLKVVGTFYFAWAMVFPVLRDTNAFGISDMLKTYGPTSEQLPELRDILDNNSTLQTSAELKFGEKNKTGDNLVEPLRMFDPISKHKNQSENADSREEHDGILKSLPWFVEAVSNLTTSLIRTKRDSNYDLLSRLLRLDPVDIALNLLRIEDQPNSKCRERLVCDARYLASTIPYVDDYLPHANRQENFNPAFKYEEAAFVGAQKQDCSIFSCSQTSVQLLTSGL